jgi:hypothetical protein
LTAQFFSFWPVPLRCQKIISVSVSLFSTREDLLHLICLYYTIYKPHSFTENVCTEIRGERFLWCMCISARTCVISHFSFLSSRILSFFALAGSACTPFCHRFVFLSALHVCEIPQLDRLIFIYFAVIPARDLFLELHKEQDQRR